MSDRQNVAGDIAAELGECEASFDATYAKLTTMLSRLPAYQIEGRISPVGSQKAFRALTASAGSLIEARGHLVEGHHQLEVMRRALRLDPVSAGGALDKPPVNTPPDGIDTTTFPQARATMA